MMLFVSDNYAKRNPDFSTKAEEAQNNEYDLKNFVYTLAEIMEIKALNDDTILNKSIFYRNNY